MNVFKVKLKVAVHASDNLDEVYEAIDTVAEGIYCGEVPFPIRISDNGHRYFRRSEVEVVS